MRNDIIGELFKESAKLEQRNFSEKQIELEKKINNLQESIDYLTECVTKLLFELSAK